MTWRPKNSLTGDKSKRIKEMCLGLRETIIEFTDDPKIIHMGETLEFATLKSPSYKKKTHNFHLNSDSVDSANS